MRTLLHVCVAGHLAEDSAGQVRPESTVGLRRRDDHIFGSDQRRARTAKQLEGTNQMVFRQARETHASVERRQALVTLREALVEA